jgi:hypothetical protein
MQPVDEAKGGFFKATIRTGPAHHGFDDASEILAAAVTWTIVLALVLGLYAVMFLALYRWSHYAPVFSPDSGDAPSITQVE